MARRPHPADTFTLTTRDERGFPGTRRCHPPRLRARGPHARLLHVVWTQAAALGEGKAAHPESHPAPASALGDGLQLSVLG